MIAPKSLDRRLLVVGDSVMLGAQEALVARLTATAWEVTPVLAESLHTYDAPEVVDANRAAIGDVVVVSLGTNDGMTPARFADWIDGLMERLRGVRRVYWVNLRPFADWVPAANAEIAAARERWRNLRVIDWEARAGADPSLVYADGIHLTDTGRGAMAELVGATVDDFAGVPSTTTTTAAAPTTSPSVASTTTTAARVASPREDDGTPAVVLVALGAAAVVGAGLVALGWARRPRGRHSRRRGRQRPRVQRGPGPRPRR
jgi:lysophospholipase L1-like esterase